MPTTSMYSGVHPSASSAQSDFAHLTLSFSETAPEFIFFRNLLFVGNLE